VNDFIVARLEETLATGEDQGLRARLIGESRLPGRE
jgi:hypothetical protein